MVGRGPGRKAGFIFPAICPEANCGEPLLGVVMQIPGNRGWDRPKIAFCAKHGFYTLTATIKATPFRPEASMVTTEA